MAPSIVAVLAIGGTLGPPACLEPDHLAAVSTLATRPGGRRLWGAARLGLIWGLGHTVTVGAVALLIIALGVRLPAGLWPAAELLVAALLILLGAVGDLALRAGPLAHAHPRAHRAAPAFPPAQSRRRSEPRAHARGGRRAKIARLRHCATDWRGVAPLRHCSSRPFPIRCLGWSTSPRSAPERSSACSVCR